MFLVAQVTPVNPPLVVCDHLRKNFLVQFPTPLPVPVTSHNCASVLMQQRRNELGRNSTHVWVHQNALKLTTRTLQQITNLNETDSFLIGGNIPSVDPNFRPFLLVD
jgi:hypothetical protein